MKKIFVILLLFLLSMTTVTAATKLDKINAREREQKRKVKAMEARKREQSKLKKEISREYKKISDSIDANNAAIKAIFNSISKLENEIGDIGIEIDELELEIEEKNIEIDKVKLELEDIRAKKERLKKLGALRIKSIYENGDVSIFEILFNSTSISDFFNKVEYTKKMVESDNRLFEKLEEAESETVAIESSLEIAEDTLSFIIKDKNLRLKTLNEKVVSRNKERDNAQKLVDKQLAEKAKISDDLNEAKRELNIIAAEEAKLDRELDRILAEKQKEIEKRRGDKYSGGKFIWPLKGYYRISSKFGYRRHPITRRRHLHNGVDLPAPKGKKIVAAGSGQVIRSRYHYSYGNYVAVAHGDGYMTLYAHMSKRSVKVGDVVKAGQKLGEVGTTGSSTGNHLHFSVKKDGKWQNPMKYFK